MSEENNRGRHAGEEFRDEPWMTPPPRRKMPKIMRKALIILGLIALAVLIYYIYLLLNPAVGRHVEYS